MKPTLRRHFQSFTILTVPLSVNYLAAAVVHTGELATSYRAPLQAPFLSSLNQSTTYTIDLSDLTGLVAGQPIRIDFSPDSPWFWEGSFDFVQGDVEVRWTANSSITVGASTAVASDVWSLGVIPFDEPATISGFDSGPVPPAGLSLVVPWGTDLSTVPLTVTDRTSIIANSGRMLQSSMTSTGGTFTTTSIPEPVTLALIGSAMISLLKRQR
jgi:hypothetical protein